MKGVRSLLCTPLKDHTVAFSSFAMSTMPSTSTHRPADILDGPSFAPQWNAIEELDEVIEGDTAEAADADGVDADSYTRWLFSDEREEIRILLEASQKKTARIEAKFRREEEECTLADAIMVKIARDLTIKQLDIVNHD